MDSFKEQIVVKQLTGNDSTKKILIMVASLALGFSLVIFSLSYFINFAMIAIFLACLAVYGGVMLMQRMNVEYEYIYTNGDLDIDKITAQKSRKRLASIKISTATAFGAVDENTSVGDGRTVIMASSCNPEIQDYYVDVTHKSFGNTTLVFSPDDDMLRIIKSGLPRTLRNSINISEKSVKEDE